MIQDAGCARPVRVDDGYEAVRKLIFHQVYKFVQQYGGEFEDLVGEAHELFMKGHEHYNRGTTATGRPIRHNYSTHIRLQVWYGLFDTMRTRLERARRNPTVPLDGHDIVKEISGFDEEDFVAGLSADAAHVAELVLHPPVVITRDAEAKGGTPCKYRSTVRAYLRLMGWSTTRVNAAFAEIKTALG